MIYADEINKLMGRTTSLLNRLEQNAESAILNTRYSKSPGGADVDFYETTKTGALLRIETLSFPKEYVKSVKSLFTKNICQERRDIKKIITLKREHLATM